MTTAWLQVNVGLARPDGTNASARASARAFFALLTPLVSRWRKERRLSCLYFQRKPPDIRLRLRGPAVAAGVPPELHVLLRQAQREGRIERWFRSVYEPEERKFGGPGAAAAVHDHFDADTRAWIALDALWASRAVDGDLAATIVVALVDDLFSAALADSGEIWDAWANLADLVARAGVVPAAGVPFEEWPSLPALAGASPEEEAIALRRAAAANQRVADRLRREHGSGRLSAGLRAILPFVAQHDLQRWGFDGSQQASLALSMTRARNPHRTLRGA